jgi:hypothetical protein
MEMNLYFSALVLTTCALHLGGTASAWIDTWWNKNVPLARNRAARAADSDGLFQTKSAPQRSDWYAFFHCADLVGREPETRRTPAVNHNKAVSDQKRGQDRRINAYSR